VPSTASAAFISYARADSVFALRLASDLKAAGAAVWLDQLDIRPGQPWDDAVEAALRTTPQMLILLSPPSVASDNVRDEIAYALEQGKPIVPILIEACNIPLRLQRKQRIDFTPGYDAGLQSLLNFLSANPMQDPDLPAAAVFPTIQHASSGPAAPLPRTHFQTHNQLLPLVPTAGLTDTPGSFKRKVVLMVGVGGAAVIAIGLLITLSLVTSRQQPSDISPKQAATAVPSPISSPAPSSPPKPFESQQQTTVIGRSTIAKSTIAKSTTGPSTTGRSTASAAKPTQATTASEVYLAGSAPEEPAPLALNPASSPAPPKVLPTAQYEVSCNAGNAVDCYRLAGMYAKGNGGTQDFSRAAIFYRKSCDLGDAGACTDLGDLYHKGNGMSQDDQKATALYRQSCDGGNAAGCFKLGVAYQKGLGTKPDKDQAIILFKKACRAGSSEACSALQRMNPSNPPQTIIPHMFPPL
jgi:hypothetical protein